LSAINDVDPGGHGYCRDFAMCCAQLYGPFLNEP